MYYSQPGAVADTMAAVLKERARAGVRVLFVLDAFGSQNLKKEWADSLRARTVELALLRQLHWYSLHNASDRSHVRVVVVDGAIGYTGGFGLADYWLGERAREGPVARDERALRGARVMGCRRRSPPRGPSAPGELISGDMFFPKKAFRADVDGGVRAGCSSPRRRRGARRRSASSRCRSRVREVALRHNSYFVPDDDFRKLLKLARAGGVDVRILTVSKETDVKTTWWAGRSRYEGAAEAGIASTSNQPTMMHSKTFIVASQWGLDRLDELRQPVTRVQQRVELRCSIDTRTGAQMDSTFLDDLDALERDDCRIPAPAVVRIG
jgi:cardiolipin synthase